ncbi:hypothetical protein ISN45_Aa04g008010 [Arabidopsis thaliana x Arabidopsis arenosa]|uniref:Uncharacterized protein n=1 Tax=Arabidopsis thaliana x Arabidopsis arenosa TaxID=1240361 RepID=A0A8T2A491_9BRAS|nr:hypothetical protein ISN45_Aa04g008010 [Arabidopsis thaliana x Arabidopsis arenosa]
MSSPAIYVSDNEDDSQGIPVPRGDEVFTQVGDRFGPHFRSQSTHASLGALLRLCNIPQEIEFSLPGPNESPQMVREGFCCAYEVYFKGFGSFFPIPEVLILYLLHLGIAFPQMAPNFLRYVLSTLTVSAKGDTNWNSFTLQRIHGAGLTIKDGKTHPLDPPPEEKDVSSLNARDKRKIHAEIKALKDQLSEIGKKKRIAAISKVGSFHRKTLLVDDGSLEAALSSAVDSYGADIPNDPPVATTICSSVREREREETPPLCTKRKAPDSDTLSNERLKTVRLSSPLRAPSFLPSVFPSVESSDSELTSSGDRAIPEETDEPRPETYLSQGLSVRTQSPLAVSISGEWRRDWRHLPRFSNQGRNVPSSFFGLEAGNPSDVRQSSLLSIPDEATALLEETNQKTELLIRNKARDIAEAEHNAREEMRGFGRQLIQSIMKFVKDEEVWTKLQSDRAELKSNLYLIGGIESGRILLEDERREVSAELATVDSELSSASRPSLDLGPFSLVFGDSPSQFEVGEGSRPYEGNSSEKPSDSFKLISDDLSGAPDTELAKTGRAGEPEGSRILRKGTSIQVPIVLIERLSAQDRVKAEEFINKLITRHDELEDEKKEIRKKRRELGKRCLDIARELHCLEAHPSDWIELGLQEYGNMPGCIMSIVDLAGQVAELFRNSRPF